MLLKTATKIIKDTTTRGLPIPVKQMVIPTVNSLAITTNKSAIHPLLQQSKMDQDLVKHYLQ